MFFCVFLYVSVHVYMHVGMYTCVYVCVCTYVHVCGCMCVCVCEYICIYACGCTCVYIRGCMCVYVGACVFVYVGACVFVYVGAHVWMYVEAKGWCWVSSFNTLHFIFKRFTFIIFMYLYMHVCTYVSECHICDTVLQGHERVSDLLMLKLQAAVNCPLRCCKYPSAPHLVSLWALCSLTLIEFLANQFLRSTSPALDYKWVSPCLPFHWIQVFTFARQVPYPLRHPSGLTSFLRDEAGCTQGGLAIDLMLSLNPSVSDWEWWSTALIPVLGKWVQVSLHSKTQSKINK